MSYATPKNSNVRVSCGRRTVKTRDMRTGRYFRTLLAIGSPFLGIDSLGGIHSAVQLITRRKIDSLDEKAIPSSKIEITYVQRATLFHTQFLLPRSWIEQSQNLLNY